MHHHIYALLDPFDLDPGTQYFAVRFHGALIATAKRWSEPAPKPTKVSKEVVATTKRHQEWNFTEDFRTLMDEHPKGDCGIGVEMMSEREYIELLKSVAFNQKMNIFIEKKEAVRELPNHPITKGPELNPGWTILVWGGTAVAKIHRVEDPIKGIYEDWTIDSVNYQSPMTKIGGSITIKGSLTEPSAPANPTTIHHAVSKVWYSSLPVTWINDLYQVYQNGTPFALVFAPQNSNQQTWWLPAKPTLPGGSNTNAVSWTYVPVTWDVASAQVKSLSPWTYQHTIT